MLIFINVDVIQFAFFADLFYLNAILSQSNVQLNPGQLRTDSQLMVSYCSLDASKLFKGGDWLWVVGDQVSVFKTTNLKATRLPV